MIDLNINKKAKFQVGHYIHPSSLPIIHGVTKLVAKPPSGIHQDIFEYWCMNKQGQTTKGKPTMLRARPIGFYQLRSQFLVWMAS